MSNNACSIRLYCSGLSPAPNHDTDFLSGWNAHPSLCSFLAALLAHSNLPLFICVLPWGFLPFVLYVLLPCFLSGNFLAPGISLLFSLKPRFFLFLILSACQPCLPLYCLAVGIQLHIRPTRCLRQARCSNNTSLHH